MEKKFFECSQCKKKMNNDVEKCYTCIREGIYKEYNIDRNLCINEFTKKYIVYENTDFNCYNGNPCRTIYMLCKKCKQRFIIENKIYNEHYQKHVISGYHKLYLIETYRKNKLEALNKINIFLGDTAKMNKEITELIQIREKLEKLISS